MGVAFAISMVIHLFPKLAVFLNVPPAAHGTVIAGLIVLSMASGVWGLALGLLGVGVLTGYNYFTSLYYSTAGSPDENRSSSLGMHEATLGLGFAAGSLGGGLVGSITGPRARGLMFWALPSFCC